MTNAVVLIYNLYMPKRKELDKHTTIRIYQIDRKIRDGEYPNCTTLAKEFELHPRTIQRDIEALKDFLGADIRHDRARKGYYYGDDNKFKPPALEITEGELLGLFLSEKFLPYLEGPLKESLLTVIERIKLMSPNKVKASAEYLASMWSVDTGIVQEIDKDIFMAVSNAMVEGKSIEIKYHSSYKKKDSERVINPYHIRYIKSAWYVIAYCHNNKRIQTFSMSGFKSVKNTGKSFKRNRGFNIYEQLDSAWRVISDTPEKVVVQFDKSVSSWIAEKKWHKSQNVDTLANGDIRLSFNVAVNNEIIGWILGFGDKIKVISPKKLKSEISQIAQKIVQNNK